MADKIKIVNGMKDVGFSQALYDGVCDKCGYGLEWEANFDADGTTYNAECCDLQYYMYPSKVNISVDSAEG